ncbi:unnamed protein product [Durusdinium trenchii]|uniref:CCHC-type domain-containing protein n=1 Tax=Durusdinium trenchii TaxID=1381693 RepID=A0ABP0KR95_9DINO
MVGHNAPFKEGNYRMTVEELKKVTKCAICRKPGHWHKECPDKDRDRGAPKEAHVLEEAIFCGHLEEHPGEGAFLPGGERLSDEISADVPGHGGPGSSDRRLMAPHVESAYMAELQGDPWEGPREEAHFPSLWGWNRLLRKLLYVMQGLNVLLENLMKRPTEARDLHPPRHRLPDPEEEREQKDQKSLYITRLTRQHPGAQYQEGYPPPRYPIYQEDMNNLTPPMARRLQQSGASVGGNLGGRSLPGMIKAEESQLSGRKLKRLLRQGQGALAEAHQMWQNLMTCLQEPEGPNPFDQYPTALVDHILKAYKASISYTEELYVSHTDDLFKESYQVDRLMEIMEKMNYRKKTLMLNDLYLLNDQAIYCDLGKEFKGHFELMADQNDIYLDPGSLEMPTQRAITERAGRSFKEVLPKTLMEAGCSSWDEWHLIVDEVNATMNRLSNKSGFSPIQRMLGYSPRLPGGIFQGGEGSIGVMSRYHAGDAQVQRSTDIRTQAAVAFHQVECEQALKHSVYAGPKRFYDYEVGQTVYFWRKGMERQKKDSPAFWHGPGKVILTDLPNTIWVSYRGTLVKAAPEHLRPITNDEKFQFMDFLTDIVNTQKEIQNHKIRNYIILDEKPPAIENAPLPEQEEDRDRPDGRNHHHQRNLDTELKEKQQRPRWDGTDGFKDLGAQWTGTTTFFKSKDKKVTNQTLSERFLQLAKKHSQGGYLLFYYHQDLETSDHKQDITIAGWKSYKLKRCTVNTLSAECQSMLQGIGNLHWHRFLLAELFDVNLQIDKWESQLASFPFVAATDSKSLYDTMTKCRNTSAHIDDKRTGIDLTILKSRTPPGPTWCFPGGDEAFVELGVRGRKALVLRGDGRTQEVLFRLSRQVDSFEIGPEGVRGHRVPLTEVSAVYTGNSLQAKELTTPGLDATCAVVDLTDGRSLMLRFPVETSAQAAEAQIFAHCMQIFVNEVRRESGGSQRSPESA